MTTVTPASTDATTAGPSAVPAPPSGVDRAWVAIAALALGGFGLGTTEFATMGVLPLVADDLAVSVPRAGVLVSAYAVGVVVGAPLLAVTAARFPRRAVLLVLMTAIGAASALSALAPTFGLLLLGRFLSGLPHGAYFGLAALVAASLVPPDRRGRAVARVMIGLTVANIAGVPLATLLGQQLGWRSTYWSVAVLAAATVLAVRRFVPVVPVVPGAGARTELTALRNGQVWLTLAVGAVGSGGFFAVYAYLVPTLQEVTGFGYGTIPLVLGLFGVGMTVGTEIGGRLADRSVVGAIAGGLAANAVVLAVFPVLVQTKAGACVAVLLTSGTSALVFPALQTRLMDVAGDAQTLAATGNHASFNVANAQGAALGGLAVAAGWGWTSTALVGCALAVSGLLVLALAVALERGTSRRDAQDPVPASG